jgi:hypothetical protein
LWAPFTRVKICLNKMLPSQLSPLCLPTVVSCIQ